MRTKNSYLWGNRAVSVVHYRLSLHEDKEHLPVNRAVSVVHYRLSLHEDKEHLPVGKQGSLCGTLQAVTA